MTTQKEPKNLARLLAWALLAMAMIGFTQTFQMLMAYSASKSAGPDFFLVGMITADILLLVGAVFFGRLSSKPRSA